MDHPSGETIVTQAQTKGSGVKIAASYRLPAFKKLTQVIDLVTLEPFSVSSREETILESWKNWLTGKDTPWVITATRLPPLKTAVSQKPRKRLILWKKLEVEG
jgi:hypothetical protein